MLSRKDNITKTRQTRQPEKKTTMCWNWVHGCCNCTPKEMAIVCGLAVVIFAVWWVIMQCYAKYH